MAQLVHSRPPERQSSGRLGTLEVHLIPKRQVAGYLWSYIWTIELTSQETAELLHAISVILPTVKVRAAVRRIVEAASKRSQPFGPGSLKDYNIAEDETTIRFALTVSKKRTLDVASP